MSVEPDVWPTDDQTPEPPARGPSPADLRRTLEEANTRAAVAERRAAFLEAGVDVNSATGKLLVKGYDGPIEVEAIRTEWQSLTPAAPTDSDEPTPEELQAANARRTLAAGNDAAPPVPAEDPYTAAMGVYQQSRDAGHRIEYAEASYVAKLFEAANAGDPRVDPRRHRPQ